MKIKNLFFAATMAALSLTSCNKEDGVGEPKNEAGEGSLRIVLQQPDTRAGSTNTPAGYKIAFEQGALLFVDAAGNIHRYVQIVPTAAPGVVTATELATGVVFEQIHEDVTEVHVIGNVDMGSGPYANLQAALDKATTLLDQVDAPSYGLANSSMYGFGTLTTAAAADPWDKEAQVDLKALVARFEVDKISAELSTTVTDPNTGVSTTYNINPTYNLGGIYINYAHYKVKLNGMSTGVAADFISNGQTPANYKPDVLGGNYDDDWFPYVFESTLDGTAYASSNAAGEIVPANDTWAFNLFTATTPHIIIHLTGVSVNGSLFNGDGNAYLTVSRYLSTAAPVGVPLNVDGNNVYRIKDLHFTYEDLSTIPEPATTYSVNVTVTPMVWTIHEVTGGIDRQP